MRDGFLATMVAQYKKSQSRSAVIPSSLSSRPPSSISHRSTSSSTPIPRMSAQDNLYSNNHEQTTIEYSTSASLNQQRPTSAVPQTTATACPALVAKCQSCNLRGELIVCSHCENVICAKCANEHQSVINADVKREWNLCKAQFEAINEKSSNSFL